ncbi:MAG: [FeFe] hydrogenase H-cluster radical SAM maturase HydG [Defluviitaleaceae bacterium]|nr:[FeFe] hydrogenase H-cluster radical SAM maturase HydG [Defluviitaleaceae bacterium]
MFKLNRPEILDTLEYAEKNKSDRAKISAVLQKAAKFQGLNYREASLLLAGAENDELFALAGEIKRRFYGSRIVLFAPLYLSDYCVNTCTYCPFHAGSNMPRKKLSRDEIETQVRALLEMGHKRVVIEAGDHPEHNTIDYITDAIDAIYGVRHENGAIRRINVNIGASDVETYAKLKAANIGTYTLFQETYDRERYEEVHPGNAPKSSYEWQLQAMDRAMQGGLDDVGMGVLFGLSDYRFEVAALLSHAEYLEATYGAGPHTISVPRMRGRVSENPALLPKLRKEMPAPGHFLRSEECKGEVFAHSAEGRSPVSPETSDSGDTFPRSRAESAISEAELLRIVAVIRIAAPYTGIIASTRENADTRAKMLAAGVSQISGGSRTNVGGYGHREQMPAAAHSPENESGKCSDAGGEAPFRRGQVSAAAHSLEAEGSSDAVREPGVVQFKTHDNRTLGEVVSWLIENRHLPSFCTACYRKGRTGDRFMQLCKSGEIQNCCGPNAILTLQEYLIDYADERTKISGEKLIAREIEKIPSRDIKNFTLEHLEKIKSGGRCFSL